MLFKKILKAQFCVIPQLPISNLQTFRRVMSQDNDVLFSTLTPDKIVEQLDKRVIGQEDAKKTLAIAFRNRLRRMMTPLEDRIHIKPSNILMEGPTGCGKSELCKALAALTDAPFVRVQATKYTQVGYVGKDVTSIGADLMREARQKMKQRILKKQKTQIDRLPVIVNKQIVNSMLGVDYKDSQIWLKRLKDVQDGLWDERQLTILPGTFHPDKNSILSQIDGEVTRSQNRVADLKFFLKSQYEKKVRRFFVKMEQQIEDDIIKNAEENGIVFIDEIDKTAVSSGTIQSTKGVSTQGVQRDFLPLLQGTSLPISNSDKSKHIRTDNVLFIAGGSFARVKVQDLLPQLLGRLPVKVNLREMKQSDLIKILQKQHGLLDQQISLLKPQGVNLEFSNDSIEQIARTAYVLNINTENIGARRLMTMIEKIMKDYSFNAHKYNGTTLLVTKSYVSQKLKDSQSAFDVKKRLI